MTKRKSDGQRIAEMLWDAGWLPYSDALHGDNPYKGRGKKK